MKSSLRYAQKVEKAHLSSVREISMATEFLTSPPSYGIGERTS